MINNSSLQNLDKINPGRTLSVPEVLGGRLCFCNLLVFPLSAVHECVGALSLKAACLYLFVTPLEDPFQRDLAGTRFSFLHLVNLTGRVLVSEFKNLLILLSVQKFYKFDANVSFFLYILHLICSFYICMCTYIHMYICMHIQIRTHMCILFQVQK